MEDADVLLLCLSKRDAICPFPLVCILVNDGAFWLMMYRFLFNALENRERGIPW